MSNVRTAEISMIRKVVAEKTPEAVDAYHMQLPEGFTEALHNLRLPYMDFLQGALTERIKQYIAEKDVLELGPGKRNLLHDLLLNEGIPRYNQWNALEIHPAVVAYLNGVTFENYRVSQGSAREIPFPDESFDTVCGLCVLDSINNFDTVLSEIYRVLRPGGHLVHTQDLLPSNGTIFDLLAIDPLLDENSLVKITEEPCGREFPAIKAIRYAGVQSPIPVSLYMHTQMERLALAQGFSPIDHADIPVTCGEPEQYMSMLIMQK